MKKFIIITLAVLVMTSCATLKQNIEARKNLKNCKYELVTVKLKKVDLDGISVKSLYFDLHLKITNTTKSEVALDRVEGNIFLDRYQTSKISHKKFVRIKPSQSAVEVIEIMVPFKQAVKSLGRKPDKIIVKAKVFVNIMIGSFSLRTPISIEVTKAFPIPYDEIEKIIRKNAKNIKKTIKSKIRKFF
ncbi:MAG: hypothetical protein GY754_05005 [bacterium]|nr:hypothetical protein [bacterium]